MFRLPPRLPTLAGLCLLWLSAPSGGCGGTIAQVSGGDGGASSTSSSGGASSTGSGGTGSGSGGSSGGTGSGSGGSSGGTGSGSGSSSGGTGSGSGSSSGGSSGGSSSTSGSSGSGSGSSSGGIDADASPPLNCPPMSDAGAYQPLTYTPATAHQGVCSTADVSAFISALGSQTGLNNWIVANVAGQSPDGGGAGTACGNCVFAPQNNGGTFIDGQGFFGPNYAGCIQIEDPTSGTACAAAWNNQQECVGQFCDGCTGPAADLAACENAADQGPQCGAELMAYQSACSSDLADGGPGLPCFSANQNADFTYVITLICGM